MLTPFFYTGEDLKPNPEWGAMFEILTGTALLEIENGSGGDEVAEVADHSPFSIFKGVKRESKRNHRFP